MTPFEATVRQFTLTLCVGCCYIDRVTYAETERMAGLPLPKGCLQVRGYLAPSCN